MPFERPRILADSEQSTIRGKCLVGHATKEEIMLLIGHFDLVDLKLRSALEMLSGCLPSKVYVYGDDSDRWSDREPTGEFEVVDFNEVLGVD